MVINFMRDLFTLQFVPCHRRKDRTLCIKGKYLPVCSRCMAILIGYLFLFPILIFSIHVSFLLGILLNIPMFVDGYTQLKKWRKSNNTLRVITGLLGGIGQSMIIVSLSLLLINFLLKL